MHKHGLRDAARWARSHASGRAEEPTVPFASCAWAKLASPLVPQPPSGSLARHTPRLQTQRRIKTGGDCTDKSVSGL